MPTLGCGFLKRRECEGQAVDMVPPLVGGWADAYVSAHPKGKNMIPEELKNIDQWVCWRLEIRDGKQTKVPYSPTTGKHAKCNDPATWGTYNQAVACHAGLGFVFSQDDPYCGIDFDKCVDNGVVRPSVLRWVERLNSYTEFSPSGRGLHVIVHATLPPHGRKSARYGVEMYDNNRFFTMTGNQLAGTPTEIRIAQSDLLALHSKIFPQRESPFTSSVIIAPDDQELIERMFNSKLGEKIRQLWAGNTSQYHNDKSAADLALASFLAFWTKGDMARIDRLFRQSRLYRPKWDKRHSATGATYGQMTIAKAVGR